jgi:hypothetical protein
MLQSGRSSAHSCRSRASGPPSGEFVPLLFSSKMTMGGTVEPREPLLPTKRRRERRRASSSPRTRPQMHSPSPASAVLLKPPVVPLRALRGVHWDAAHRRVLAAQRRDRHAQPARGRLRPPPASGVNLSGEGVGIFRLSTSNNARDSSVRVMKLSRDS